MVPIYVYMYVMYVYVSNYTERLLMYICLCISVHACICTRMSFAPLNVCTFIPVCNVCTDLCTYVHG